jgi:hypothetical protein
LIAVLRIALYSYPFPALLEDDGKSDGSFDLMEIPAMRWPMPPNSCRGDLARALETMPSDARRNEARRRAAAGRNSIN